MRLVTSDETGLMKLVDVEGGKVIGGHWGVHDRAHAPQRMCWAGLSEKEGRDSLLAAATPEGVVQTWKMDTKTITSSIRVFEHAAGAGSAPSVVSLDRLAHGSCVVACIWRGRSRLSFSSPRRLSMCGCWWMMLLLIFGSSFPFFVCMDNGVLKVVPVDGEETQVRLHVGWGVCFCGSFAMWCCRCLWVTL